MCEVWRARDAQLDRDVAIKVLPPAFTENPDSLARFEREARFLAQLNHANIAQIYGMESSGETRALVMELVEGPTLAERMQRGALPLEECLSIARQIAEALEEAHEKGIIHRDLKPQNVKLTTDGKVKVLDFGLAKAMDPGTPGSGSELELTHSPTMTVGMTVQGVILGTAAYMSPEQASGRAADRRSDIWAFGVVLYEMLTGQRLFEGETVSHVLAGVLKEEPEFSGLPLHTPPRLARLLGRCLRKNPRERLQAIGDARVVLEETIAGADDSERRAAGVYEIAAAPRGFPWAWSLALGVVALVASLIGYVASRSEMPEPPSRHLAIQLAASQELVWHNNSIPVFEPDGESIVFPARENGSTAIFRRRLDEREARPIPGTENGDAVFLSPDGRWIGFVAGGKLWKVEAEGGRPFPIGEALGAGGSTWLSDDSIIHAPIYSEGLYRVSAEGGDLERLTSPDRGAGELGHWWPQALPGEKRVLFTAFRTPVDESRVGVLDLESGESRWVVERGFFGRYVPTGHLLYGSAARLYAVPFDPVTATVTGSAVAVLDDVRVAETGGYAAFDVSSNGTLAYVTESLGNPVREMVWLDRDGRPELALREVRQFLSASLSPDDRYAAVTIREQSRDIWTYSFDRGTLSRLTSGADTEFDAMWSPDGDTLYYVVDSPPFELFRIDVGHPDSGRRVWEDRAERDTTNVAVSADGAWLTYVLSEPETGDNVYARRVDGGEPHVVRASRAAEGAPSFSPDGRWIVYQSDETGRPEVYVQPFPGPGERFQITSRGATEPLWARNGEIFFRSGNAMYAVSTRVGETFEFEPPVELFDFSIVPGGSDDVAQTFDVSADGRRILAVAVAPERQPRQIEVVTHWTRELKRLVPGN
jgi:serine/threonine-protein kinase